MTRKSSSFFSAASSGSIFFRSELASSMSCWDFSRLFQKVSWVIRTSSSASRFCVLGTSKKPPQMGEFASRGGQLFLDDFKHGSRIRERGGGREVRSQRS